jgi:predicted MFS family arabinose efflux permease
MLVGVLSWRWAFLINVPVALVILMLTLFVVPTGRSRENVRLDIPGAASVTLGLLSSPSASLSGPYLHWSSE